MQTKKKNLRIIFLKVLIDTPLEKLEKIFRLLSQKASTYRQAHSGFFPMKIFKYCASISDVCPSVEIVMKMLSDNSTGFALKKGRGNKNIRLSVQLAGQINQKMFLIRC